MKNRRHFPGLPITLAAAVLAITLLVGCTETKQNPPAPPPPPSEKVFVIFEGPWGFAQDPKDANFVIAMAPKTKDHRSLYVRASHYQVLDHSGVYDLSMPARTATPAGTIAPGIVQAKIDPKDVQRVLDDKLERYAIRLPKPEAYAPESRFPSLVGSSYPPTMEDDHATAVSLQYSVGSLNTFQLTGNVDSGPAFPPYVLKLDIPVINFVIAPAHDDDPNDLCYTHARQAFHDLTKLLGVTLFLDFSDSPANCRAKDPQRPPAAKAQLTLPSLLEHMAAFTATNAADVQEAGMVPAGWLNSAGRGPLRIAAQRVVAAFLFFAQPSAGCKAPPIVGNGGT
jgi:hypothetical protein